MKSHPSAADCAQLHDLLPAYSFGLTDEDETRIVASLLPLCTEATTELPAYQALAERMLTSVPQIEPPADLLTRLMQAAAESPVPLSESATTVNPKSTVSVPSQPQPVRKSVPVPSRVIRWSYVLGGLAAVMIGVLLAFNVWILNRVFQLFETTEIQSEMLNLFADDDVLTFEFVDQRENLSSTPAHGFIDCHPDRKVALVRVENFPQPTNDDGFHIWLWRNGERIDGGKLTVDQAGEGQVVFEAPEAMGTYQWVAITTTDLDTGNPTPIVRANLYSSSEGTSNPNAPP